MGQDKMLASGSSRANEPPTSHTSNSTLNDMPNDNSFTTTSSPPSPSPLPYWPRRSWHFPPDKEREKPRGTVQIEKNYLRQGARHSRFKVTYQPPAYNMSSDGQDDASHRNVKPTRDEKYCDTSHTRTKRARDAEDEEPSMKKRQKGIHLRRHDVNPSPTSTFRSQETSRIQNTRTLDDQARQGDDHHAKRKRTSKASRSGDTTSSTRKSPSDPPFLDEDATFREALFDALSDPAGAEYWARVFGQPIHIYSRWKVNSVTGAREQMADDEYVAYVRRKMWETTNKGYLEAQARRRTQFEEARAEAEAEEARSAREQRKEKERRRIQAEIDRSLRRAEERKLKKTEETAFADYNTRWKDWDGTKDAIPWPTDSGSPKGITEMSVRSFFLRGLGLKAIGTEEFNAQLKEHRVRWHPDKFEHKMGGRKKVEESVLADVTMIFQVIDTLYNDTRKSK